MSTTYEDTPPISDRIAAVQLVIVGEIEDVVETTLDRDIDPPRPQTVFSVAVREVLYGRMQRPRVRLRFAGKEMGERHRPMVFLLAPDYGSGRHEDSFVPYFNSIFVIGDNGLVQLEPGREPMRLPELRHWIEEIHRKREESRKELHRLEPDDLLRHSPPEFREMPGVEGGPSRLSQPEGEPPNPRP